MFNYLKIEKPKYNSSKQLYFVKDVYHQTEPYDDLFSFTLKNLFKEKEEAYKELILWLYFEQDYEPNFHIQDINAHQITEIDIVHLEKYLDKHLKEYGFSWEVSEIKVLFNKEEI